MKASGSNEEKLPTISQLKHPFSASELKARLSEALAFLRTVPARLADAFPQPENPVGGRAIAQAALKLGATGFGGGIAILAQIRRVVVRERKWMTDEEFLDAVSLAQSLPGANAANAMSYVGLKLGGPRGAAIALSAFVLPSFLIMVGLTIAHGHLEQSPDAKHIFQGFNAAVVGLIAATTARLGQTAMQRQWHLELGVAAGFLLIFTQTTVAEVVLVAGLTGLVIQSFKARARRRIRTEAHKERQSDARSAVVGVQARQHAAELIEQADNPKERLTGDHMVETALPKEEKPERKTHDPALAPKEKTGTTGKLLSIAPWLPLLLLATWPWLTKLVAYLLASWQLAAIFLRVGTVTFGGGFVMIPQIETDIVEVNHWMNHQTFADGMAFGQITPGPVLITATFIGYKVAGLLGAVVATVAAFLPSFVMTVIAGASLNRFRSNHQVQSFLAGVAPAVVGMLAAAGVSLARSGLKGPVSFGMATLAFLLMMRARVNPVIIIFGCGVLQWAIARGLLPSF
jgi:chromate transporter